jgi:hypothetical protein
VTLLDLSVGVALRGHPFVEIIQVLNKSQTIFHFPFEIFHLSLPELAGSRLGFPKPVIVAMTRESADCVVPDDK